MPRLSALLMDHFAAPRNQGALEEPDAEGFASLHRHGPFVRLTLGLRDGRVELARFQTFGCGVAIGLCSFLTEWMQGRPINECLELTEEAVEQLVGRLPDEKRYCASLALAAVRSALGEQPSEGARQVGSGDPDGEVGKSAGP